MPITRRRGSKSGRPLIGGTKIGVYQIYAQIEEEGLSVDQVVEAYRELSRDDVEEALAYAADHPEEMENIAEENDRAFRDAVEEGTVFVVDDESG